jgi:hypothetical protein
MADNQERRASARARRRAPKKTSGATPETKAKAARVTRSEAAKEPAEPRTKTAATPASRKAATTSSRKSPVRATPTAPPKPTPAPPRAPRARPSALPVKAATAGVAALQARRQAWLRGLLDAYEHTVLVYADYEERLADVTRLPWVKRATHAHAEVSRHGARLSTSAARQLLGA